MKVLVNKCPDTGDLFEDDKEYKNHRAKINKQKAADKKACEIRSEFGDWLHNEKLKIVSPEMIAPWFLKNQRIIMEAHNAGVRGQRHSWGHKFYLDSDEFTKFEITSPKFSELTSNSGSCPANGVTNWCGRNDTMPRGYPGWSCRVDGALQRSPKHMSHYPYSDALNLVGIHVESGGGGNRSWGYSAKIFVDDWPGLKIWVEERETEMILKKLKGQR